MKESLLIFAAFLAIQACAPGRIQAELYTDGYIDPPWQGLPNTTYQEWTRGFTNAQTNAPTILNNPNGGTINAGSPVGFVTSTNGIYHFGAKVQPTVTISNFNLGDGYNTTLRWQVSIDRIGEWLDLNTVSVTPLGGSPVGLASGLEWIHKQYDGESGEWIYPTALTTSTGTGTFQNLGFFNGIAAGYGEGPEYTLGYQFEWTLPGNVESYTFNATALGTSMSFKGAQVDTIAVSAVPEPSSMAFLLLGVAGAAGYRLKRKGAKQPDA